MLEHGLAEAIKSKLTLNDETIRRKVFDGDHEREGILGTIYTRNIMAYALGLYGENTFNDINSIRVIRNLCAHAQSRLDLSTEAIVVLCKFHALENLRNMSRADFAEAFGPKSPVHAMMQFVLIILPYLVLHCSSDWLDSDNHKQWREIFA